MNYLDNQTRDSINKEGFVSVGGRDPIALLIGTKENMPQLLEKLEADGHYVNLETYIRSERKLVLPKEAMSDDVRKWADENKGVYWDGSYQNWAEDCDFSYVDSSGQIFYFAVDSERVTSLKKAVIEDGNPDAIKNFRMTDSRKVIEPSLASKLINAELESLGFEKIPPSLGDGPYIPFLEDVEKYNTNLERVAEEQRREKFDL